MIISTINTMVQIVDCILSLNHLVCLSIPYILLSPLMIAINPLPDDHSAVKAVMEVRVSEALLSMSDITTENTGFKLAGTTLLISVIKSMSVMARYLVKLIITRRKGRKLKAI